MYKIIVQIFLLLVLIFHSNLHSEAGKVGKSRKYQTIRESINTFKKESPIFLITDLDYTTQYIIDVYKYIRKIDGKIYKIDNIKKEILEDNNIIAIGIPQTNSFIKQCLDLLPLQFDAHSVTIEDTKYMGNDLSIIFSIPNPYNPEKNCIISTTNNLSSYSPLIHYQSKKWCFIINRKSDGRIYEQDNLAVGNFRHDSGKFIIDSIKVWKKKPQDLTKLSTEGVTIYYNGVTKDDAQKIMNIISTMRQAIIDFGIKYKHNITAYFYKEYSNRLKATSYTDAVNTFWSKFESVDEFYSKDRMQIAILAHEMARIAFQPWLTNREKIGPLYHVANDWSHYFQQTCIIPYVWDKLGAEGWPHPYDYNEKFGLGEYKAFYQGCNNTYTQILYEIDQKYGKKIIADVVNEVTGNGKYTFTPFEDFMMKLAKRTKDDKLVERTKHALPTPMENTYRRRMHPIGITPTLDNMICYNNFNIVKVEVNSIADYAGLKIGDEIIKFNGHDVKTEKDLAHRKGLQAWRDDGYISFQVKRQNKIHEIEVKIKKR
jgi:hypothetical protein